MYKMLCRLSMTRVQRMLRPYHSHSAQNEHDLSQARSWLSRFTVSSIPPAICDFSFSRSSGPGGQNVNKSEPRSLFNLRANALPE